MKKGVYLKAAKLITEREQRWACHAIVVAVNYLAIKHKHKFSEYFYDPESPMHTEYIWFGVLNRENQLARTLALLLMHEMEKDGSL